MADRSISIGEAARLSGVSESTLRRWADAGVIPIEGERWTEAAAAHARVVARMRARGHSLDDVRDAAREGRLATGYVEGVLPEPERTYTRAQVAERTGLEEGLVERIMTLLGTPTALEGTLTDGDAAAIELLAEMIRLGFPLVARRRFGRPVRERVPVLSEVRAPARHTDPRTRTRRSIRRIPLRH